MSDDDLTPRRRRPLLAVVAVVVVTLLVGGALIGVVGLVQGSPPSPSPAAPSAPVRPADPALVPVYPEQFDSGTAATETSRLAGAMVSLIDPAVIVNDDEIAQEVPAAEDAAGYFGVLHTLTLDPVVPPASQAEGLVSRLAESGWIQQDSSEDGGFTRVILVSGTDPATSWLVLIGADASVPGESVVSVQLASPSLP